jgi:hypothetical protein
MVTSSEINLGFLYSPYSIVAYLATVGAVIYASDRKSHFDRLFNSLRELPEEDRIHALEMAYGPIPEGITADEWIRDRKNFRLFLSIIAIVAALTPIGLFMLHPWSASKQAEIAKEIFNIPDQKKKTNELITQKQDSSTAEVAALGTTTSSGHEIPLERRASDDSIATEEKDSLSRAKGEGDPKAINEDLATQGFSRSEAVQGSRRLQVGTPPPGMIYYPVGASIGGVLEEIAPPNRVIKAGDSLAKLECKDLEAEQRAAEANAWRLERLCRAIRKSSGKEELNISQLEIDSASALLKGKEGRLSLLTSLSKNGAVAAVDLDAAENEANIARVRLKVAGEQKKILIASLREKERKAREQADYAGDQLRIVNARLGRCEIRSPKNGIVLSARRKGDRVTPGAADPVVVLQVQESDPKN